MDEYTEKYEFLNRAIKSALDIERQPDFACSTDLRSDIVTGQVILNDLPDSEVKEFVENLLDRAVSKCKGLK